MTQRTLLTRQLTSHNTSRWQVPAVSGRYPDKGGDASTKSA
jgi:hypothetical protein